MSQHLRDYQLTAADGIEREWLTHCSTMTVIPTGGGKTVLFAEIIRRRQPGRALVIAHRQELIHQAKEKIEHFTGLDCEIEMGAQTASTSLFSKMPVVIATVQTLVSGGAKKRMEKFRPEDFSTLIIDEFHHSTASTYRKVIDYFRQNPNLKILGVTATPDRTDEEALGQICESVAFNYEIVDAISDGWLVPIEQQMVTIAGLDFSAVRTTAGDLNGADLAAIMESEKNLHGLCSATLEIIGVRQTIVFTASVKHAEMASNIFNRHREGISEWVCGETPFDARQKTMSNVKKGRTQILVNVGIATEGFDAPGIECIVMGRPTKSRALYAQMAGRATRPLPGIVDGLSGPEERKASIASSTKPSALLIDFSGNAGRHKLVSGTDLLGGKYSDEEKAKAKEMMVEGDRKNIGKMLDEAKRELARIAEEKKRQEEARKAKLLAKATYSMKGVNPFDLYGIAPAPIRADSNGKQLSEKQRAVLLKQGIDPDKMPYAHAKQLLDEQFRRWGKNLCSLKQSKALQKYGYDTKEMSRVEAARLMDGLARNNWKPTGIPQSQPAVSAQLVEDAF